ncbi:DUF481 domain-containing protein [Gallaecimonas pentaromativorans]|uniref:Putative salt-induced outer membrane protein YdiY n=1 Tax=Gallaecimonas pentaromativorans TaxID=584787 RepID=A0A3N1P4R4_9GAMM|nr:DUF481 domain-containing protein [Gallaecimonas pentaromativorans]ROQ23443.1 putative salt-induced outer membrane protein YdiY [Gallaecimonas pentaromativorans]
MKLKYGLPALAMLVAQAAHADDAATAPGEKKTWKGSMELGVLVTSGNSKATNINGKLNVTQDMEHWRNTYNLESLYTDSDEETTAERYRGAVQGDYKFNDKEFWYVRGAYEKDRFSGYDYQSSVSTGYGNRFWQVEDGSFFEASAGVGYRSNEIDRDSSDYQEGDESDRGAIGRLAAKFEYHLTDTSLFRQELNTEIGLEDGNSITESVTSLQANVMGNLAMKVSYRIKYTSDVPADTEKTDTETSFTLLYSF